MFQTLAYYATVFHRSFTAYTSRHLQALGLNFGSLFPVIYVGKHPGCTQAQLRDIQPGDLVRVRKGSFGCEALVRDRAAFARKYPGLMLDRVMLEDIMLLIGKGESA